jgi:alcohol dehydrogenase class IV
MKPGKQMLFEFATANRIRFGEGVLAEIGQAAAGMGRKAIVVAGASAERASPLLEHLETAGLPWIMYLSQGEPTIEVIEQAAALARAEGCNLVIGYGGGSPIDAAKAVSALLTNPGGLLDYLEVVGRGQPLTQQAAPCIAVPTTAGTGAEVTRNAVLGVPEQRFKVSMRSPFMLPRLALVDPLLTYTMPPQVTASTGLDAITQLIEPYVSSRANPLTDPLCQEGLMRAARSLKQAYLDGSDRNARLDMSIASLFGGLALANSGLGAVHGFASPLGGMFPAPHGAICARLLPLVIEANIQALRSRQPGSPTLERYQQVASLLTGRQEASAEEGAEWAAQLVADLHIPPLAQYGLALSDIPVVVEKAARASSMQANPIRLTEEELQDILSQAIVS